MPTTIEINFQSSNLSQVDREEINSLVGLGNKEKENNEKWKIFIKRPCVGRESYLRHFRLTNKIKHNYWRAIKTKRDNITNVLNYSSGNSHSGRKKRNNLSRPPR